MSVCDEHWDRLRAEIDKRGISHLISESPQSAAKRMTEMVKTDDLTKANYDPLLYAWSDLLTNAGQIVKRAGGDPLYVITDGPEEPIDHDRYPKAAVLEVDEWPRCCVCYLSLVHQLCCSEPNCRLDIVGGYEWTVERAAEDALEHARDLGFA